MRYYQYISDAKAEMLFQQIPAGFLDGLKVELGFDFGLFKGKLGGEQPSKASRVARVEAVERYLDKNDIIKSEPEEKSWLRGSFSAKVGYLSDCPGLVLFGGTFNGATLILAGSEAHLLSGSANPGKDVGWSFMPRLLDALRDYLDFNYDFLDISTKGKLHPAEVAEDRIFGGSVGSGSSMVEALRTIPEQSLRGIEMDVSFLARMFWVKANGNGQVLALGSPLYVA